MTGKVLTRRDLPGRWKLGLGANDSSYNGKGVSTKGSMWLTFGEDSKQNLVPISQVSRGKTQLRCPYCQGWLTAKKGKVLTHHFAHTDRTCRQVQGDRTLPVLPCYDRFNLHLSPTAYRELEEVNEHGFYEPEHSRELLLKGCIEFNPYRRSRKWQLTKLGKMVRGSLSLMLFNQIQEPMAPERLIELEEAVIETKRRKQEVGDLLTDLRLYRAQYRRILSQSLYFLEIEADGEWFHKIGVTTRDISDRIPEIERDLGKFYRDIQVKCLGTWEHRGNVEPYFKYRYQDYRKPIATLTEYFDFEGDVKVVLRDLRRMKPKTISPMERSILTEDFSKVKRSLLTRAGMKDAENVGRPKEKPYAPLLKYPEVVKCLEQGMSLRQISEETGVSVNTIRKVGKCMRGFT